MKVKLFVVAALAIIAITGFFVFQSASGDEFEPKGGPEVCTGDECPATSPAEQELARRYAPVVYLTDEVDDCNQKLGDYRPVPVEIVLGNDAVSLRQSHNRDVIRQGPTAADLYNRGTDYHLDLPGNPRRPGCRYVRDGLTFSDGQPSVAYARITKQEGFDDELVLQYWLYYYFNQWNNKHESDWEMVQLIFEAPSAEEALSREPVRVGFSQHSIGEVAEWDDEKLEREGTHPVLRIAAGSHSNRFGDDVYLGRGQEGFGCDSSTGERRVVLETRLMPATVSGPDDPWAWLTYRGRWGQPAGPQFDGPTGPNMKRQWDEPLSWEESLSTSSVSVPGDSTAETSSVQAFCDVVAFGSKFLMPIYLQLPAISYAVVGLFCLGTAMTLTRTQYLPVLARPLRVRRRFGQILLSAFDIYRHQLALFLGIGLVLLPLTLTVSLLHWLLLDVSPIESIVPFPRANATAEIFFAIALGELQFGLAAGLVLAASTATIAALDRGSPASVTLAYKEVLRRLTTLVPARLGAAVVVAGLGFTIVGIPFAVRQAVRWSLLEQAILFEGAGVRGAFQRSSELARRDWWWTAVVTLTLGLIGLFAAPVIGIVLILAVQSLPLATINLITSLIHVALIPYVAIGFALVFFNLEGRG